MDHFVNIIARADENQGCTKSTCDASQSVYGYSPNLGATLFFLILFALSGVLYVGQGIKTKTWFFTYAVTLGAISEVLGYVAKLILHNDPFSDLGFKMSVVLLTFAPAFYSAGIYYTLKHICLTFGADFSRLRPAMYTYIFISCDVFSILLQAVGGALASAASDQTLLKAGDNVMITGLVVQVFTLVIFAGFVSDYAIAVYRNRSRLNPATEKLRNSLRFRLFVGALVLAFFCILVRSCYRVAELAGGWANNPILRNQLLFICLDSLPIGLAAVAMNIWHPGYCFPRDDQETVAAEEKMSFDASSISGDEEARIQ